MRLFLAVDIGAEVAAAAADLLDELRRRAHRLAPSARVTWIPAERLHITVRFIGNADEPLTRAIEAALDTPLPVAPFAMRIQGTGAFPPRGAPRVLVAGVADEGPLHAVEREVTARLKAVGVAPDDRPYRPHLTLARIRDDAGLRPRALFEGLENRTLGTACIEAITLYESLLSPKGPTYVPRRRTALWKSS